MPIAQKDLGKYRRPGIFIEEIDKSIIQIPIQDVLINIVPGFSKKGPINKPVYIESRNQFEEIFGEIDRQLEKKESYFHRTVIKMLESGPVWALNLLHLEDDRDKVQWVSVSLSSKYSNYGIEKERKIPYSKIFNRQDFWERDDEAFLDYLKTLDSQWSSDRLLEMVNVGNRDITVFLFKSSAPGFDITAEEWYGGSDKVPAYINPTDWISDWMVNLVIVRGNWTNYKDLSVDSTWGDYFNENGLIKDTIQDFLNERKVTTLASTDVSLIPYFTDLDGRDMYIKTVVNDNTDTWNLFISYNEEFILDSDYPIDVVDIIGNSLVKSSTESINFMSYKQSIMETINFENTYLNSPGNTWGNITSDGIGDASDIEDAYESGMSNMYSSRSKADYTKWFVNDVLSGSTTQKIDFVTGATSGDTLELENSSTFEDGEPIYFNNTFSVIEKNKIYYVYKPIGLGTNQIKLKEQYDPDDILDPISDIEYTYSVRTHAISSYWEPEYDSNPYYVFDDKYELDTDIKVIPLNPISLSTDPSDNITQTDIIYIEEGDDSFSVGSESVDLDENKIIIGVVEQSFSTGSTTGMTDNDITATYNSITVGGNGYIPLDIIITGDTSSMIIDFDIDEEEEYESIRKNQVLDLLIDKIQSGAGLKEFQLINLENYKKVSVGTNYLIE
ncbi:MAG: hypothetical protein ACOCP8_08365, partial [archaeon]